MTKRV